MHRDDHHLRGHLARDVVSHLVREAQNLVPDLEDRRGHRDDVAGEELPFVLDVLLEARHAQLLVAQARPREPEGREQLPGRLVELGHVERTFMCPMWSQCDG